MHKRALALTLLSASLPVMMAAMLSPSLPALQLEFGGEPEIQLLSKLVLMTPALAIAMTAAVIGFFVDRWGRYPILILSLLIFGLFGVQGYWADDIYALIATRFFFGIGVAGIMMTTSTALASHYEGFTLRRMLGFQAALMGVWGILFQIAAGFLAEKSWREPFLLYGVSFLLVFLVIMEPSLRAEEVETVTQVMSEKKTNQLPLILTLIILSGAIMSFFALVPVQGPLFFHALHFSPKRTSFLISMLTASSCSASLVLAVWRRHISSSLALLAGLVVLTIGFFWLGNADRWRDLVLSMVGIGAGVGLVVPCISALIGTLTPSGQKGKLLGALLTVNYVGQFLAPIWSQMLLQGHSNNDLFLLSSAIIGGFAAIVLLITIFTLERSSSQS